MTEKEWLNRQKELCKQEIELYQNKISILKRDLNVINGLTYRATELYRIAELLNEFCAETHCSKCPIREMCYKVDEELTIGRAIMNKINF